MHKILSPGQRSGTLTVPSSKSVVHRLLICAALGETPVLIRMQGLSKDIRATAECLRALGAGIEYTDNGIRVTPITKPSGETCVLPCGESGSTLRFLLPVAGILNRNCAFAMEGRLPERPMEVYEQVLTEHGMQFLREGKTLCCSGQLQPGEYRLPGNVSSQFFTGLLMTLPLLDGESCLRAEGHPESAPYLALTEQALKRSHLRYTCPEPGCWQLPGGQRPALPAEMDAEGDWSNAAFFLCMGALSEQGISVRGLDMRSKQGDRAVLKAIYEFGACIQIKDGSVTVSRFQQKPFTLDASEIPDLVPTLAVLACGAEGETRITNASRLRLKESDRLAATAALIRALGGSAEELPDGLLIRGTGHLRGGVVDTCNDHRIAMSAAVAACLATEPVEIPGAECVAKSYPNFWEELNSL